MRKLAIGLWGGQVVAAIVMLIVATIRTESILITGPILATMGLLLALFTQPLQSWSTLLFALAAPLVGVLIAIMIAVFEMSPDEGHRPTLFILLAYIIASSPLALITLRRLRQWEASTTVSAPVAQFSLKSLLIVMTSICVLIGLSKLLGSFLRDETYVFSGYALFVILLSGVVAWRNLSYPYRRHADTSKFFQNL